MVEVRADSRRSAFRGGSGRLCRLDARQTASGRGLAAGDTTCRYFQENSPRPLQPPKGFRGCSGLIWVTRPDIRDGTLSGLFLARGAVARVEIGGGGGKYRRRKLKGGRLRYIKERERGSLSDLRGVITPGLDNRLNARKSGCSVKGKKIKWNYS